ncbi:hypothetical protein A9Q86_08325 [Flavobacteriales bacterium 33_180_T64]|nr:hypothetical protein A9Q86_08325 [Flavobacteriales bacterium 33_180_T64]
MKRFLSLLLFLSLVTFTSCEDILECVVFGRSPELPDTSFDVGLVNLYYYEEFDAEIKNEPRDNDYEYFFEIDGYLPDGLEMNVSHRTVSIEGSPQSPGSFTFSVFLYVDPPLSYDSETDEYDENMCSTSTSKEYTIIINQ